MDISKIRNSFQLKFGLHFISRTIVKEYCRKMSNYMNYSEASKLYDEARVAADAENIYSIFTGLLKKPANKIDLLDIGCGTGNYSYSFMKNGLQSITIADASQEMLDCAKIKMKVFEDKVTAQDIILPNLPFPEKSFDVISCMQVLHHIDSAALKESTKEHLQREDYPNMLETLSQAYNVLKPGGVLVIDVMFEENCESFWWTRLCPIAAKAFKRLRMSQKDMIQSLEKLNFENIVCTYFPGSRLVKKEIYDEIQCIDDPKWRYYLSQYKLVEKSGELDNLIKIVKDAETSGKLKEYFDDWSEKLWTHGNHSAVFAMKPLA